MLLLGWIAVAVGLGAPGIVFRLSPAKRRLALTRTPGRVCGKVYGSDAELAPKYDGI